jgi:hypothetical protein
MEGENAERAKHACMQGLFFYAKSFTKRLSSSDAGGLICSLSSSLRSESAIPGLSPVIRECLGRSALPKWVVVWTREVTISSNQIHKST